MNEMHQFDPQEYNIISTISQTNFSVNYLVENIKSKKRYNARVNLNKQNLQKDSQKLISNEIEVLIKLHHPIINDLIAFSITDFDNNKNITTLTNYSKFEQLSSIIDHYQQGKCKEKYDNTKLQIILIGICFGMMYLHENHILHGNLRPENIYIDDNFQPIISDFGLTQIFKLHDSKYLSNYKNIVYLAPEILKNNQYSEKSDIYAFGMVMYEIIFGCRCYSNIIKEKHLDEKRLKSKIINGLRPKIIKPIKKGLQQLIESCWSSNLSERPTFSELYKKLCGEDSEFLLDDVNLIEMMEFIEKIQNNENNEKYQTELDLFKTQMDSMKEIIIQQSNEIRELKQIIKNQSENMNSKILHEHYEVHNMREYILNQIRKDFVLYKKHCYPTKLLLNLDEMFHDHNVVKLFSKFCISKMCIEYYYYVEDMNAYYGMKEDLKSLLFYDFRDKYFIEGAPYFLNIKTSLIKEICETTTPRPDLLDKALDLVYAEFKIELIRKFKRSPQYNEYLLSLKRHKSRRRIKRRKV